MELRENEKLETLCGKIKIIHNKNTYNFSIDSVLLADFIKVYPGEKVVDLGTGTGVLPLLLAARVDKLKIIGVEIQDNLTDIAARNIEYNNLEDNIFILNEDLNESPEILGSAWDAVISNPPYFTVEEGRISPNMLLAIARHEIKCSLEQVIFAAGKLLKKGGRFYLVHRHSRRNEILKTCLRNDIYPTELQPVASRAGKEPYLILLEGVKGVCGKTKRKAVKNK